VGSWRQEVKQATGRLIRLRRTRSSWDLLTHPVEFLGEEGDALLGVLQLDFEDDGSEPGACGSRRGGRRGRPAHRRSWAPFHRRGSHVVRWSYQIKDEATGEVLEVVQDNHSDVPDRPDMDIRSQ
jgi:hypothetical protein